MVRSTSSWTLKRRRAEFHGGGRFTRYRYPIRYHQPTNSDSDKHRAPAARSRTSQQLPPSLRTITRYGQEPTVQSSGQRRRVEAASKARVKHAARTTVRMVDRACQCSLQVAVRNSCCQAGSGATCYVNQAVSTGHQTFDDAAVMTSSVDKINKMIETDIRLVDVPQLGHLITDKLTFNTHWVQLAAECQLTDWRDSNDRSRGRGSSPAGRRWSRSNRGPGLTQPSILSWSVNEYRLRLVLALSNLSANVWPLSILTDGQAASHKLQHKFVIITAALFALFSLE